MIKKILLYIDLVFFGNAYSKAYEKNYKANQELKKLMKFSEYHYTVFYKKNNELDVVEIVDREQEKETQQQTLARAPEVRAPVLRKKVGVRASTGGWRIPKCGGRTKRKRNAHFVENAQNARFFKKFWNFL